MTATSQDLVERALARPGSSPRIVLLSDTSEANLRWANNTLTTNGAMRGRTATVISFSDSSAGVAAGSASSSVSSPEHLDALVDQADAAAAAAAPAEDAAELVPARTDPDWSEESASTGIEVFADFAPGLGEAFGRATADHRVLYGFAQHLMTTTYLGSTTGLRLRHVQPTGHYACTGKNADLTQSAWVGSATRDFADADPLAVDAELTRRLQWASRTIDLPAGRYDTLLPPSAVADVFISAYWYAGARDAHDGQSAFSRRGGGTRIGDSIAPPGISLYSDPRYPGLECSPFAEAPTSSSLTSVFDNGLPLERTDWITDGTLTALLQTRHSAALTHQPTTPYIDNLVLEVSGAHGTPEEVIARTDRGLLLTCMWYIRVVDEQSMLFTGLTRDGVYLVEDGEVVGAVNNFRFNESPLDLLARFTDASQSVPSFSREWGDDYFSRDFNMSSVSEAR